MEGEVNGRGEGRLVAAAHLPSWIPIGPASARAAGKRSASSKRRAQAPPPWFESRGSSAARISEPGGRRLLLPTPLAAPRAQLCQEQQRGQQCRASARPHGPAGPGHTGAAQCEVRLGQSQGTPLPFSRASSFTRPLRLPSGAHSLPTSPSRSQSCATLFSLPPSWGVALGELSAVPGC